MAKTEEQNINEMITELFEELILEKNDLVTNQEEKVNPMSTESVPLSVETTDPVPTNPKPESMNSVSPPEVSQPSVAPPSVPPQHDQMNHVIGNLFSGLLNSFVKPESGKNNEMEQMIKSLFSSMTQTATTPSTSSVQKSVVNDKKKDDKTKKEESNEKSTDETKEDVESADETEEDVESADETEEDDESTDETEEDDESADETEEEEEEDDESADETEEDMIYIIETNGNLIGYTTTFEEADQKILKLYRSFLFSNQSRFLRTYRSLGKITIYERNPYVLLPFSEQIVCQFTIRSVCPF